MLGRELLLEVEAREEFSRYTNAVGLVDDKSALARGISGNMILFHSHYVWTMVRRSFWKDYDSAITKGCVAKCEIEPGLVARSPEGAPFHTDQEGPDDQIGYCSMSAADPKLPFAKDWLRYGRSVKVSVASAWDHSEWMGVSKKPWWLPFVGWIKLRWIFNTELPGSLCRVVDPGVGLLEPNWHAWMGRFPQNIAHAQFCAREKFPEWRPFGALFLLPWLGALALHLGWWNLLFVPAAVTGVLILGIGFRRLWWCASVWQAARFHDTEGTDEWILTWDLVASFRASGQKSWLCELAARNFTERLFTKWPGGLNSVFDRYFGSDHPFTKFFLS